MTTSGTRVFDDPNLDVSIIASEDLGILSSVGRICFTSDCAPLGKLVTKSNKNQPCISGFVTFC
jgi:hypothetical protein